MTHEIGNITISDAANQLDIGKIKLFRLLRSKRIFNGTFPRNEYVSSDYFRIAERHYSLPGRNTKTPYNIALVTAKGMTLIHEIVKNAMETDGQILRPKRQRRPCQRSTSTEQNSFLSMVSTN